MTNGGFGGGSWGGGPFGGAGGGTPPVVIAETVTLTEGLVVVKSVKVLQAVALSPYLVRVDFSSALDYSFGSPTQEVTNFVVTSPSLDVYDVAPSSPNSVILQTAEQGGTTYLLTVNQVLSLEGDSIDPTANTALFAGFPIAPSFFAAAQSSTKVELVFSTEMLQNAAFTDPASYTITTLQGSAYTINSATASGPSPIQRVTLELDSPLTKGGYYVATINTGVVEAVNGQPFVTDNDLFQWNEMAILADRPLSVPIANFSGEVTSGLLGQPAGQIFFSPALETAAADSSIQIDEVSLCTRAYDVYEPPSLPDPIPLATFGGPTTTLLNDTDDVLWAPAWRLGLAQINLGGGGGWLEEETWGGATDGPADATLEEPIDIQRAAFLNDTRWTTYPGDTAAISQYSMLFDGVDEYVTVGDVAALKFVDTDAFSIAFWFKTTFSAGAETIISKRENGGNNRGYQVQISSGEILFSRINTALTNNAIIGSTATYADGQWHFCVCTTDGTDAAGMTIYIDNVAQTPNVLYDNLSATIDITAAFQISGFDGAHFNFDGYVDDVAVYDVELTAGQADTLYNSGSPGDLTVIGPTGDLVGYWKMGDGASFPTIPDDSTNSNDGTATNMEESDLAGAVGGIGVFRTADNLTSIGAGATVAINLQL